MLWSRNFLGVLLFLSLSCATASAQATGQISGAVTDQTGALIPGAEITATQTDTGLTRTNVSNETGHTYSRTCQPGHTRLK